ncbi:hypothetical protein BA190_32390 [Labrys sp. WJW]|nr:hypothetical protein BA190_32390 [Labrys sp. WJW]
MFLVPDPPVEIFGEPKRSLSSQGSIDLECRERLPGVYDCGQRMSVDRCGQDMHVVWHDTPGMEAVSHSVEMEQGALYGSTCIGMD